MIPVLTLFNAKDNVKKTFLAYHLISMMSAQDIRVLAVDLDPQANLTTSFFNEDQLDSLWGGENSAPITIYHSIQPVLAGMKFAPINYQIIDENVALIPGDLTLSTIEDDLSTS
jgi:cellulose biosynthesis protein BcsQ